MSPLALEALHATVVKKNEVYYQTTLGTHEKGSRRTVTLVLQHVFVS